MPLIMPSDKLYAELLMLGTIEGSTTNFFQRFIKNDDVILDLGANLGFYTLLFATVANNTMVYSIEASTSTFKRLEQNVLFNSNLTNIKIYNYAVSDKRGKVKFHSFTNLHHGYSSISNLGRDDAIEVEVDSISIDEFTAQNNFDKIDILKIDVEGAEKLVLNGAKETIKKYLPSILMEMNEVNARSFNYSCKELLEILQNLGEYEFYKFESERKPLERMKDINDFHHGDNVLALASKHKSRI
jgi:FkbM family methyltransferase